MNSGTVYSLARSLPVGNVVRVCLAISPNVVTRVGTRRLAVWQYDPRCPSRILLVLHAQANLAKIPHDLTDEQVVLLSDIASTGFSGAESGGVRIGDTVTRWLYLLKAPSASVPLPVQSSWVPPSFSALMVMLPALGWPNAWEPISYSIIRRMMSYRDQEACGRRFDVAIEALGTQTTFEAALRV